MPLVSAAQISHLRSLAYQQLDTPFSVWRRTRVETVYGMEEGEPEEVYSGVCWLRGMNVPVIYEQNGVAARAMDRYRLHTNLDADIQPGDEIRITGIDDKYVVQDTNDDHTVQIFRTAVLRRLT